MKVKNRKGIRGDWGPAALGVFVVLLAAVSFCKLVWGMTLRSAAQIVFIWLGAGAVSAFLVWLSIRARQMDKQNKPAWIRKRMHYARTGAIAGILILVTIVCVVSILSYQPECVVEKYGYKMVGRVQGFLSRYVYYYQYEGPLFYGQEMGYEYYGSSRDPLSENAVPEQWMFCDLDGNVMESSEQPPIGTVEDTQPQTEIKELDITVKENREGELVFDVSMDDFIDSYNSYYASDKNASYLLPRSGWRVSTCQSAIHSDYETSLYEFTIDERMWSQPTITVYVPTNADCIQEITVNFDEHGYTEAFYDAFEELCFYTLKVFFPELPEETIIDLYTEVNRLGKENVFTNQDGYDSDCVPCVLYYQDGIGVYPYLAIGEWAHLCIVPVTQESIAEWEEKGVAVYKID